MTVPNPTPTPAVAVVHATASHSTTHLTRSSVTMTTRQTILGFLFALSLVQGLLLVPVIANLKGPQRRTTVTLALLILCFLPMIGEELMDALHLTVRYPHVV